EMEQALINDVAFDVPSSNRAVAKAQDTKTIAAIRKKVENVPNPFLGGTHASIMAVSAIESFRQAILKELDNE
ncbi:MAG: hypothetical protein KKD44_26910, partial [Proteobacteria bacterium]|nr:hypothetical protein [Pseudomonadota bacterium]